MSYRSSTLVPPESPPFDWKRLMKWFVFALVVAVFSISIARCQQSCKAEEQEAARRRAEDLRQEQIQRRQVEERNAQELPVLRQRAQAYGTGIHGDAGFRLNCDNGQCETLVPVTCERRTAICNVNNCEVITNAPAQCPNP